MWGKGPVEELWNDWRDLSPAERQKRLGELDEEDRERLRKRWDDWRKRFGGGGGD